jgi:hypothetical protein
MSHTEPLFHNFQFSWPIFLQILRFWKTSFVAHVSLSLRSDKRSQGLGEYYGCSGESMMGSSGLWFLMVDCKMRDVQGCGSWTNSKSRVCDMYVTGYVNMQHPRFQLQQLVKGKLQLYFSGVKKYNQKCPIFFCCLYIFDNKGLMQY